MLDKTSIDKIRSYTPGVAKNLFFNAAGAALPDQRVLEEISRYLQGEAQYGGYLYQAMQEDEIQSCYDNLAEMLNAKPEEVAITSNATNSLINALYSIQFETGDVIFCSPQEYGNNYLNFLHLKETKGVEVRVMPYDQSGNIDIEALEFFLSDRVKLLVVTHIATNSGFKLDAAAVGRLAKKYGILYMLDACQSIGQGKVDVDEIQCDFLCATSRKFLRGPRGLGFLYVRESVLSDLRPYFKEALVSTWQSVDQADFVPSIKMFEHWEKSFALVIGLSKAVELFLELGDTNVELRIHQLSQYLIRRLKAEEKLMCYENLENHSGIVSFNIRGFEAQEAKSKLLRQGVEISTSVRMMSLLDMDRKGIESCCRVAVHVYNTEDEIDQLMDYLTAI